MTGATARRGDGLFVATAFGLEAVLTVFFAIRLVALDTALQLGWLVYAMAIPAVIVAAVLALWDRPWWFWAGGPLFAAWGLYGYWVDIARPTAWRSPVDPSILVPYVALFLATQMFYWWPLGRIRRSLWFAFAALFVVSSALNLASHL